MAGDSRITSSLHVPPSSSSVTCDAKTLALAHVLILMRTCNLIIDAQALVLPLQQSCFVCFILYFAPPENLSRRMPEKKQITGVAAVLLILGFLATGSANTLTTKWADNLSARDLNGNIIQFSHPFVQALGMFFGEFACYFVYLFDRWNTKRQKKEFSEAKPGYHPLLFWGPALCDVFATSIMYFGLLFISSSVYQMMRGLVVLFVCMVSKFVLKKSYPAFKWLGVFCILAGAAIVGVVAIAYTPSDGGSNQEAFGVSCVIIAVLIQAVQVTLEEKYLDAWK